MQYNTKGVFAKQSNSHIENTPTVIASFGDKMKLYQHRIKIGLNKDGKMTGVHGKTWIQSMETDSVRILILNRIDEKLHTIQHDNITVKYQHINVTVTSNSLSIALFSHIFDKHYLHKVTNNIIIEHDINHKKNSAIKAAAREALDGYLLIL